MEEIERLKERLALAERLILSILAHESKMDHFEYKDLADHNAAVENIRVMIAEFLRGRKA